jgi:predicted dinucleotide-binding enzyme
VHISIIGAGNVGRALGQSWLACGHDVRFGVPDPTSAKYADLPAQRVVQPAAAVVGAEAIILATPWPNTEAAIRGLGDLAGRMVVDCTNPLGVGPGGLSLAVGHTTSGGELVAAWAQGASVFKAFNSTGAANMADLRGYDPAPAMFVAGDDTARKPLVMRLARDLGFQPIDAGPLIVARLLEPFAMLWIDQALNRGAGQDFAFAVVRRK